MKMLAEEKALYDWAEDMFGLDTPGIRANLVIKSDLRRLTRNLVRAVREDERMKYQDRETAWMRYDCATAIQGRK